MASFLKINKFMIFYRVFCHISISAQSKSQSFLLILLILRPILGVFGHIFSISVIKKWFFILLISASLYQKFILKLLLLLFCQQGELANDFWVVFKTTFTNNIPSFPVSLSLGDLVMLLAHVHISGSVSCILLTAVVEARELLFQFLSTTPDVFFPLIFASVHSEVVTVDNTV